jgi:hypothetical protein
MNTEVEKQVLTPSVIWYQTKCDVCFSIELNDIKTESVVISDNNFVFSGVSSNNNYSMNFDFNQEIESSDSEYTVSEKGIKVVLKKKEEINWTFLTKDRNIYKNNIRVNWNAWTSEAEDLDENLDAGNNDGSQFDMSKMQEMMRCMGGGMDNDVNGGMPDFSSMMGNEGEDGEDGEDGDECGEKCCTDGCTNECGEKFCTDGCTNECGEKCCTDGCTNECTDEPNEYTNEPDDDEDGMYDDLPALISMEDGSEVF